MKVALEVIAVAEDDRDIKALIAEQVKRAMSAVTNRDREDDGIVGFGRIKVMDD